MKERIRQVMASALEVKASEITDDSSIHTVAAWDSLQHLKLVMALEEAFQVKFTDKEMPELDSFLAIESILKARLHTHGEKK